MEKEHIWLSQYEWQIFTKFLEIWRKNGRQPVTTLFCQTEGLVVESLLLLYLLDVIKLDVIKLQRKTIPYWSRSDVNVGVMIAGGDRDTQEADE